MQASTRLKPKYLRAMLNIAAKQDIRYYLNGVRVEMTETETLYIACDGHKLAVIRDEREKQPPQAPAALTIPRETIEILPKQQTKGLIIDVELRYDTEAAGAECRLGNVIFEPLGGKFPVWQTVLPKETPSGERGNYNPEYMMAFQRCVTAAFSPDCIPELWQNGNKAGVVLVGRNPEFVGLIMPMRDASDGRLPDWARRVAAEPKAVEPLAQAA